MDRIRLVKWNESEVQSRGWEGGMKELSADTGLTVEELEGLWWVDDDNIENDVPLTNGKLEIVTEMSSSVTGFIPHPSKRWL